MPSHVRSNTALWRYPSLAASWRSHVPPLPHYCGLHEGALTRAQVEALQANWETSFLESQAVHAIPGLSNILEALMKIVLAPLMDAFMEQVKVRARGGSSSDADAAAAAPRAWVGSVARVIHRAAAGVACSIWVGGSRGPPPPTHLCAARETASFHDHARTRLSTAARAPPPSPASHSLACPTT